MAQGADVSEAVPDREDAPSTHTLLWRERLRADTAERELRRANRVLARLGEMVEGWPEMFGPDEPLNARRVAASILMTIRETP
jgi:hypothetical protein